jgi:23S rRNA (cytosine1962-C5)-methyltransferase
VNNNADGYELLDSGTGRKLERFGSYILARPCATAVWRPSLPKEEWEMADASFDREDGQTWTQRTILPKSWNITVDGLKFSLSATSFGHVGIFPEQIAIWARIGKMIAGAPNMSRPVSVLNLFAYSGGSTLAAARAQAAVCHLDASRGMVQRARENAGLNGLDSAPVRWIVDDVGKFLGREVRRGIRYDAIILDPPSFGRGKSGEVFKIEESLESTLNQCANLLSDTPCFMLISCHTPAYTPTVLTHLLHQTLSSQGGSVDSGEMLLEGKPGSLSVPSGTFACWTPAGARGAGL